MMNLSAIPILILMNHVRTGSVIWEHVLYVMGTIVVDAVCGKDVVKTVLWNMKNVGVTV
jgi:hypothetical protein